MKKLAILLAACFALTLAMVAQDQPSSTDQTSTTTTTTKTTKKHRAKREGASAKEHSMTGCLSGPNSEGAYMLTNGRYKKGVEVGGNDELKNHVGHEVKLTGMWEKSGAALGENEAAEKGESAAKEKAEAKAGKERHFKVTKIDHLSDTCTATAGAAKKGKKSKEPAAGTPPPSM